jgi:hypothetical protein
MPLINRVKDVGVGISACSVVVAINPLTFESSKEALANRIIGKTANSGHAADQVPEKAPFTSSASEPAASIRLQYDLRGVLALPQRNQEGLERQMASLGLDPVPVSE